MRVLMISALLYTAGAMQAGTAPRTYDVSFVLTQGTYTGSTSFAVSRTGAVTGTLKLTDPQVVDATLGGAVKDGTWTFDYGYTMPERGCSGTVKGTGTVAKDMKTVKGDVTIGGACTEEPMQAAFTFTLKDK